MVPEKGIYSWDTSKLLMRAFSPIPDTYTGIIVIYLVQKNHK